MNSAKNQHQAFLQLMACALGLLAGGAASAQPDLEELEELAIKASVVKVSPSVVRIETFGGAERVGQLLVGTGPTTGLVVSEDGYVISSAFNFAQRPSSILITLPSGDRTAAEIVARDHSRMLVLLKVSSNERLVVPCAVPRGEMVVGQWAIAVGRTFDKNQPNMSVGILSATNRIWGKAIQTDAKISPANYGGPLVDLHGHVLGILVPLAPDGTGEIAGAEWYDSGIGFAVPLDEVLRHLDKLKRGEDLFAGILGVSLEGGDIYSNEAVIAAVPPKSPAANAGVESGDKIIELDGVPISRQSQLKHALGGRYAGETVHVVLLRGQERIERSIELTDKLVPYEHPFLGILPRRNRGSEKGMTIRFVYSGSPAEQAGLKVGDRVTALNELEVPDAHAMQDMIAAYEVGEKVQLTVQREQETRVVELELARLPVDLPATVTPARDEPEATAADRPPVGAVEVKIPEEANDCLAYVPENYRSDIAHGLIVWLHEPGGFDRDALLNRWKEHCETRGFILLAPKSADPKRWQPTEADFVRKTIDDVLSTYNLDRKRIVVHGYQAGGTLAYLIALGQRELIRGVAAVDAPLPRLAQVPANDPIQRLAIYTTTSNKSKLSEAIQSGIERLQELKFPVTVKDLGEAARYLDADEVAELARWIDTLDRI